MSTRQRGVVALAAAAGYLAAVAFGLLAWQAVRTEWQATEQLRFGTALADQLAARAEEPLLRQDRVSLGMAANRAAMRAEVRQVAIHTMDGRPFVVAGESPGPRAPVFSQPVVVADEVTAEVRVALRADAFALPLARALVVGGPFLAVGLVVTVALAFFGGRAFAWWRRAAQTPDADPAPPTSRETREDPPAAADLVVANLFAAPALADAVRAAALGAAARLAEHIAEVYDGEVAPLAGTGCALCFRDTEDPDRHFNAVCAALLLRRLLERWQANGVAASEAGVREHLFRYAVDHFAVAAPDAAELPGSQAASDVLLLSSLVRNGEIVIGEAALGAVAGAERLLVDHLDNPAAAALATAATPGGVLRGVAQDYETLLDTQAREIGAAFGFEPA